MRLINIFVLCGLLLIPTVALQAQDVHQELQETVKAEVLSIEREFERDIVGTDTTATVQEMTIRIKEGVREGEVVDLDNDLVMLAPGDIIFVNRLERIDGTEYYAFKDVERRSELLYLFFILVALVVWFAGRKGLRALLSLGLSIGAIFFVLVPALLNGYSPVWVSLAVSTVILAFILFITHGIKMRSVIAFIGTVSAVAVTCSIAAVWVEAMRLTGFGHDASVYLNFSTGGGLDFAGLLLGGIIIGLLGVLDDIAITQVSVVQELRHANASFGVRELYTRAIRVGQDHVGSLVNTLALAYMGTALPIVLLFASSEVSFIRSLNQEVVAAEVLRIIIGSIGLVITVPLTTFLAAWYFKDKQIDDSEPTACAHHH